jgi:hypothetical protein
MAFPPASVLPLVALACTYDPFLVRRVLLVAVFLIWHIRSNLTQRLIFLLKARCRSFES